jgi:hypothetical protein
MLFNVHPADMSAVEGFDKFLPHFTNAGEYVAAGVL